MLYTLSARGLPRSALFSHRRFGRADLGIRAAPSFGIEPADRVFCMGSCFARAVGRMLHDAGVHATFAGLTHRYNIFNMLQTVRWAMTPAPALASIDDHLVPLTDGRWFDPHDRSALQEGYAAPQDALPIWQRTLADVHTALRDCNTFIMTLGLVEVWRDERTGVWLNQPPPRDRACDFADRFTVHATTQAANKAALLELIALVRAINPAMRMVISVSPIPLRATFCHDDIFVATATGKATLRSALDEALRELAAGGARHIDYFPSYEIVTFQRSGDVFRDRNDAGAPDCLHIREDFITRAIRPVFQQAYLTPAEAPGAALAASAASG
jgi:hypothetical protein